MFFFQNKLTAVHWSPSGQYQRIACGDDKGYVIIWNILTDEVTSWQPESPHRYVYCLSFANHAEHLLLVGLDTLHYITLHYSDNI